jgi:hypothetical protein
MTPLCKHMKSYREACSECDDEWRYSDAFHRAAARAGELQRENEALRRDAARMRQERAEAMQVWRAEMDARIDATLAASKEQL